MSSLMMLASASLLMMSGAATWLKWAAPLFMAAVAIWLWRRPED